VADEFGGEDQVPGKPRPLCHVDEQGDVAVGERGDDVTLLEPRQPFDGVRPGVQAVPDPVKVILLFFGQGLDAELAEQLLERDAVEVVELRPGELAVAHPVHRGRVPAPPGVGEGRPFHVEVLVSAEFLALPDDGRAPVQDRAEHVEDERFWSGRHPILAPMRAASEASSPSRIFSTPPFQLAHALCCSS
jgi:hypothetical protein